ncbi:MAG TPA: glycosyltransferase family 4 protein [Acidobacteriaceae bacterium]|nr:glycosyltransferase family 4 protein [Acidobacteriaceae bacterium]
MAEKRKVLIIVENISVPFDDRVWKEATTLRENGYYVTVLCPRGQGYVKGYELLSGVHIYRHPAWHEGNGALGYLWEFASALLFEVIYTWWIYFRRGFHVIQGCNPPDDIFLVALPFKMFGVKYIFDHHDANPELYLSKFGREDAFYKMQLLLEGLTYRLSDVLIATNNSYREIATSRGMRDPADIFVVRNGPDLDKFQAVPPNPDLKFGKPYLVAYVGNMAVQEGLEILLDAALHIKRAGRRDIHITCIGGGPGLASLRKMVKDKDLEDMVNFTGRVPKEQLLETLSTADVCVNPDKPCRMNDISTMIKIMEYMALGKPIVQFNLKEGRFSAGNASLYCENKGGATDFAEKILWLLAHSEEWKAMGEFGRRRVVETLAWQHSVDNLLAAYERAFNMRTHVPFWALQKQLASCFRWCLGRERGGVQS